MFVDGEDRGCVRDEVIGMAWVYRYVNRETGRIEYVGITKDDRRLRERIDEHRWIDKWSDDDYRVEILHVDTRSDAEALEATWIALWNPPRNKAKRDWGRLTFLSDKCIAILESDFVDFKEAETERLRYAAELIGKALGSAEG